MKLAKYLKLSQINVELQAENKSAVLEVLVQILVENGQLLGEMVEEVMNKLTERESLTSTGLGYGVGLPHVKTDAVDKIQIVFGRSTKGIDFDALDGNLVHFFFLILAPNTLTDEYLKVISAISGLMKDENIRRRLILAQGAEEIFKIIGQGA